MIDIYICCMDNVGRRVRLGPYKWGPFKKLLTSVLRVTKQNETNPYSRNTLLYIERSSLFHTLVQFGISLVLSQVFPTPPNGRMERKKYRTIIVWCQDFMWNKDSSTLTLIAWILNISIERCIHRHYLMVYTEERRMTTLPPSTKCCMYIHLL